MFLVRDVRETRVWQEAYEEGRQLAIEELRNWRSRALSKMAALKMSAADIAGILGLDLDLVLKTMGKKG